MPDEPQYTLTYPYYFGYDPLDDKLLLGHRESGPSFLLLFADRAELETHIVIPSMQAASVGTAEELVLLLVEARRGAYDVNPSVHHVCFVAGGKTRTTTISNVLTAIELQAGSQDDADGN